MHTRLFRHNMQHYTLLLLSVVVGFLSQSVLGENFSAGDVLQCDYNYRMDNGGEGVCMGSPSSKIKCLDNGQVLSPSPGKYMVLSAETMEERCGGGDTIQILQSNLSCVDGYCQKLTL